MHETNSRIKSSPVLFAHELEEKSKTRPSNSSRIASARTCNAKPVDIERATFLWFDVDVDVFLFWRFTPRMGRERKKMKHTSERGKDFPKSYDVFCGRTAKKSKTCFVVSKKEQKDVVGYQTAHPLAPHVQVCDFCMLASSEAKCVCL